MANFLLAVVTAVLVFAGLAGAGFAAAPLLIPAQPNVYRTSIYDITLPADWTCQIEGTESVCRPNGPAGQRAVMIATMKYRDKETDTLEAYREHLEQEIVTTRPGGEPFTSKIEHVGESVIDGRTWVDATHFESEVRNYRTRYLATVTVQVAVLVTFSSYKDDFDTYQPIFEKALRSLNIYQRYNDASETEPG